MTAKPTVESLHAQWLEAFNGHDLDKHLLLCTEDAMLFGPVDALQDGRNASRDYFGKRPAGIGVKSYPMPQVRQVAADVAITAGHVDFAMARRSVPIA
jgi:ketosteroid isomerase-like protein